MQAKTRQDGQDVIFAIDGKEVRLPWTAALEISKALHEHGKLAEEHARAASGDLIYDHAIVTRLGLPFGLSSNPKVKAEVAKEAAWNSDLRRYLPGGVKSKEVVNAPTVIQHPPTPAQRQINAEFWAKQKG